MRADLALIGFILTLAGGITLLLAGITAFSLALQLRNAHHCLHSVR